MGIHRGWREDESKFKDGAAAMTLLIVSEIRFLREGLADLLARDSLISVGALCADLDGATEILNRFGPDVVLLDAAFPDGANAVRRFLATAPRTKVVAFAVTETEEDVIAWAEAGTAGYIPRTAALDDLVQLLFAILRGEQVCSTRVASGLMRRVASSAALSQIRVKATPASMLTVRERQIVSLVSAGLSNKEIARKLNIELSTVKSHVHSLLGKLNLRRRGQVANWRRDNATHLV
jgi:two-component system, NarL family, nitrate/nitrite response regulator NarL